MGVDELLLVYGRLLELGRLADEGLRSLGLLKYWKGHVFTVHMENLHPWLSLRTVSALHSDRNSASLLHKQI